MARLILNCDLGENESLELTGRLVSLVDAASIGCGYHAGNPEKTRAAIQLALAAGILIGAHPGLPMDGGRGTDLPTVQEFRMLLEEQVGSFQKAAQSLGASTSYIKLHGTLYQAVEIDKALADTYIEFLKKRTPTPAIFALAGGGFARVAEASGLRVYHEAFADRAYQQDGSLLPRSDACAVLTEAEALQRFRQWKEQGTLQTCDDCLIPLKADTLCVHADSPEAMGMIESLRRCL